MQELNFDDLTLAETPVRIGGKNYVLREPSVEAARQYRNAMMRAAVMTDGKVSAVHNLADVEPLLVSLCLFEKYQNGKGETLERPVPETAVKGWPARILKPLYERARDMGKLAEDGEGDPKNSPPATPDGSA